MTEQVCKRTMTCTCPECAAAAAAFSVDDLKQFSSNIDYGTGDGGVDENALPAPPKPAAKKPAAKPKAALPVRERKPLINRSKPSSRSPPPMAEDSETLPAGDDASGAAAEPQQERESVQPAVAEGQYDQPMPPQPHIDSAAPFNEEKPLSSSAPAFQEEQAVKPAAAAFREERAPGAAASKSFGAAAEQPPPEEASNGGEARAPGQPPSPEELTSKDWKVRKPAFEALTQCFERAALVGDSAVFNEYAPFLSKAVGDSHAACLDAAMDAVLAYADAAPRATATAEALAGDIISKGFSARGTTPAKAEAALLKFMEVDTPEVVTLALLQGLNDKKPKVPPACLACITKAADAFGASTLPLKELRGKLKGVLEHKDTNVRTAAVALVTELVKWVGVAPLAGVIDELRSAQKAEIEAATKDIVPGACKPSVYLRKLRPKPKAAAAGGGAADDDGDVEVDAAPAFDARDMIEAVDLLERLKKTEFNAKMAEEKWSEKVAGLKIALDVIGDVPKLTSGDYHDFVKQARTLTDHSHVMVVCSAFKLLGKLAEGLRGDFAPFARGVCKTALGKLADKKCNKTVCETLEQVYGNPLTLEQVLEDVLAALEPKKVNPTLSRVSILGWICTCVSLPQPAVDAQTLVQLMGGAVGLLADSDPAVRTAASDAAAAIILAARRVCGGQGGAVWAVALDLKASNARAFKKISEQIGGEGTAAAAAPPAAAAPAAAAAPGAKARGRSGSTSSRPGGSTPRGNGADAPPAAPAEAAAEAKPKAAAPMARKGSQSSLRARMERKTGAPSAAAAPKGKPKAAVAAEDDDGDSEPAAMSGEEAWAKLTEKGITDCDSMAQGLQSAKWQDRKAALEALLSALAALPSDTASECFGAAVTVVRENSKNFKDANFNVVKGAIDAVTAAVTAAGDAPVSKAHLSSVLCAVLDKIADRKQHDSVCSLMMAAAEAVGPAFVVRRVCKLVAGIKAPPAHVDALVWVMQAFAEFGAGAMPVQVLVAFAVSELDNGNPKVRSSAVELLGGMYHQLGPPLKALLPEDIKAASRSAIEAQFEKTGFDAGAAQKVTRTVKGSSGAAAAGGTGGGLPRSDLVSLLSKDCLKDMASTDGKDAWKGRKAAIEEVIAACQRSGHYVEANKSAAEVLKALRARLGDSQSNLKPLAAGAIAELMGSLDPEASGRYVRAVSEPLLAGVADNKKLMRDAALQCLDKIVCGKDGATNAPTFEAFLTPLGAALVNTVGRAELLQWTARHLPALKGCADGVCLVSPLLTCMQDKAGATRQMAEECLVSLVATGCANAGQVKHGTRDFTPAVILQLKAPLTRVYAAGNSNSNSGAGAQDADATDAASTASDAQPAAPAAVVAAAGTRGRKASNQANVGAAGARGASGTRSNSTSRAPGSKLARTMPAKGASFNAGGGAAADAGDSGAAAAAPPAAAAAEPDVMRRNANKPRRAEADRRLQRWACFDETHDKEALTELLRSQWTPLLSSSAAAKLFPVRTGSMECGNDGFAMLEGMLEAQQEAYMDSLDLVLKWFTLRLCDKENVMAFAKLLEVLEKTLVTLKQQSVQLLEYEVEVLAPCVLEKSGHSKERFRAALQSIVTLLSEVSPQDKYVPLLLATVGTSKNSRSRVLCLEEVARLTGQFGLGPVGRKGLKDLVRFAEVKEQALASAALDCIDAAYAALDHDMNKLLKNLGPISDKVKSSIEERIKAKNKLRQPSISAAAAAPETTAAAAAPAVPQSPGGRRLKSAASNNVPAAGAKSASRGNGTAGIGGNGLSGSGRSRLSTTSSRSRGSLGDGDEMSLLRRASLGKLHLELDPSLCVDLSSGHAHGAGAMTMVDDDNADFDGPFKFNDSALEVPLLSPVRAKATAAPHPADPSAAVIKTPSPPRRHSSSYSAGSGSLPRTGSGVLRAKPMAESDADREVLAMCGKLEALVCLKHPIKDTKSAYVAAKDTIKAVYNMATAATQAQRQQLSGSLHAHVVLERLVQCLEVSFVCAPAQDERDAINAQTPGSGAGAIDLNLLSTVLAALMAVVREMPGVFVAGYCLAPHLLRQLLQVVCPRLADERLSGGHTGVHEGSTSPGPMTAAGPYKEVALQVHRAMNKLAIAAAESCDASVALSAVVELLARVHARGAVESANQIKPSKVYVKLLLRLINMEKKRPDAFSTLDLDLLVPPLAHFLARNAPTAIDSGSTPPVVDAVVDLWHALATSRSAAAVELPMRLAKLPPDSFMVVDWETRLGGGTGQLRQQLQAALSDGPDGLYEQQGAILHNIWRAGHSPSAAASAIKELFQFQEAHPEAQLDKRMRYMPPAFQAYVKCQMAGLHVNTSAVTGAASAGTSRNTSPVAHAHQQQPTAAAAAAAADNKSLQYLQERLRLRVQTSGHSASPSSDRRLSATLPVRGPQASTSLPMPDGGHVPLVMSSGPPRDAAATRDALQNIRLKLRGGTAGLPASSGAAALESRIPLQPTPSSISNGVPSAVAGVGLARPASCLAVPSSIPSAGGGAGSGGTVASFRERMEALKKAQRK